MLIITFYRINLDYHLNSVRNDKEQKNAYCTVEYNDKQPHFNAISGLNAFMFELYMISELGISEAFL